METKNKIKWIPVMETKNKIKWMPVMETKNKNKWMPNQVAAVMETIDKKK